MFDLLRVGERGWSVLQDSTLPADDTGLFSNCFAKPRIPPQFLYCSNYRITIHQPTPSSPILTPHPIHYAHSFIISIPIPSSSYPYTHSLILIPLYPFPHPHTPIPIPSSSYPYTHSLILIPLYPFPHPHAPIPIPSSSCPYTPQTLVVFSALILRLAVSFSTFLVNFVCRFRSFSCLTTSLQGEGLTVLGESRTALTHEGGVWGSSDTPPCGAYITTHIARLVIVVTRAHWEGRGDWRDRWSGQRVSAQ